MKKTHLIALCAVILLGACEPTIANRGDILDPDSLARIKPGVTTREDVAADLGTPTSVSTFDDKVWYYIGRQTKQYSFLSPDIIKQQAEEIDFNDKGVVTAAKKLDVSRASEVASVERTTPSYGQKNTFIRELLGDLSHPMPDLQNPGEPQTPGGQQ